ncbi:MAG: hypothetical protein N2595_05930 [bacterium]|nr:hypothetical protein [bacterium]
MWVGSSENEVSAGVSLGVCRAQLGVRSAEPDRDMREYMFDGSDRILDTWVRIGEMRCDDHEIRGGHSGENFNCVVLGDAVAIIGAGGGGTGEGPVNWALGILSGAEALQDRGLHAGMKISGVIKVDIEEVEEHYLATPGSCSGCKVQKAQGLCPQVKGSEIVDWWIDEEDAHGVSGG